MNIKLLLVASFTWVSTLASASDVSDFFGSLESFSSDFTQVVEQDGNIVQQSAGHVKLKKPLKFLWDYETPESMQLISDGDKFFHYDVDLAQATSKPIEEVSGTAIATLLNDDTNKIDQTFDVRSFAAPALEKQFPTKANDWSKKAQLFYELTPKNKVDNDLQATKVILGITTNKELTVFYAEDAYGKNTFIFDNVKQNSQIDDSDFIFIPPQGVDVLGG